MSFSFKLIVLGSCVVLQNIIVPVRSSTDWCKSNPCQNEATCENLESSFKCHCALGYRGLYCTYEEKCRHRPCQNGATCTDLAKAYTCTCTAGFTGDRCETEKDCRANPCGNRGTCIDQPEGFQCNCTDGYTGNKCKTDMNKCRSQPCQNGATCKNKKDDYDCQCAPGYVGVWCEKSVDFCKLQPCENGATCENKDGGYVCHCAPGYGGSLCATDMNKCRSSPCKNGAICVNRKNSFQCLCAPGYTGIFCGTDTGYRCPQLSLKDGWMMDEYDKKCYIFTKNVLLPYDERKSYCQRAFGNDANVPPRETFKYNLASAVQHSILSDSTSTHEGKIDVWVKRRTPIDCDYMSVDVDTDVYLQRLNTSTTSCKDERPFFCMTDAKKKDSD